MTIAEICKYTKSRYGIKMSREELQRIMEIENKKLKNLLTPKSKANVIISKNINEMNMKYKELVRKRRGLKRVGKKAKIDMWSKLSSKDKKQFGNWKPKEVSGI